MTLADSLTNINPADLGFFSADGLSGIDTPVAIGWPWHGAIVRDGLTKQGRLEGWPMFDVEDYSSSGARNMLSDKFYEVSSQWLYPVKVSNQNGEWAYFILGDRMESYAESRRADIVLDEGGRSRLYRGLIAGRSSYAGVAFYHGIPARSRNGMYENISIGTDIETGDLLIARAPIRSARPYTGVTTHSLNLDFSECESFGWSAQEDSYTWPRRGWMESTSKTGTGFLLRVLSQHENKILVGAYYNKTSDGADTVATYPNRSIIPRWYKLDLQGNSVDSVASMQAGDHLLAVIEIELYADNDEDVIIRVVKDPKQCEGQIHRFSPTSAQTDYRDGGEWLHLEASVSQIGATIAAWYNDDGEIHFQVCDIEHYYDGWERVFDFTPELYATSISTARLGDTEVSYRQEVTMLAHKRDTGKGIEYYRTGVIANKIWGNASGDGDPIVDESFDSFSDPETPMELPWDINILNTFSGRAPFAGIEARSAVTGIGFALPSVDHIFNMSSFSVYVKNIGNTTCSIYGVVENFGIQKHLINHKRVSSCHFYSAKGMHIAQGFTHSVAYDDPRYGPPFVNYHESRFRGYVGGKLKTPINPVTGQFFDIPADQPLTQASWL